MSGFISRLGGGSRTPGPPPRDLSRFLPPPPPPRFKVFADYEAYVKCQEKVSALYKVGTPPQKETPPPKETPLKETP